jgi:hypothetical protein
MVVVVIGVYEYTWVPTWQCVCTYTYVDIHKCTLVVADIVIASTYEYLKLLLCKLCVGWMHSWSLWESWMMMSAVPWEYAGARMGTVVASAYSTRGSEQGKTG